MSCDGVCRQLPHTPDRTGSLAALVLQHTTGGCNCPGNEANDRISCFSLTIEAACLFPWAVCYATKHSPTLVPAQHAVTLCLCCRYARGPHCGRHGVHTDTWQAGAEMLINVAGLNDKQGMCLLVGPGRQTCALQRRCSGSHCAAQNTTHMVTCAAC